MNTKHQVNNLDKLAKLNAKPAAKKQSIFRSLSLVSCILIELEDQILTYLIPAINSNHLISGHKTDKDLANFSPPYTRRSFKAPPRLIGKICSTTFNEFTNETLVYVLTDCRPTDWSKFHNIPLALLAQTLMRQFEPNATALDPLTATAIGLYLNVTANPAHKFELYLNEQKHAVELFATCPINSLKGDIFNSWYGNAMKILESLRLEISVATEDPSAPILKIEGNAQLTKQEIINKMKILKQKRF